MTDTTVTKAVHTFYNTSTTKVVVATEFVGNMGFIGSIAAPYFRATGEGRADMQWISRVDDVNMGDFEMRFRAMGPFMVDGTEVIFTRPGTDMPEFKFVVRGGKVMKEFAKISWDSNQGGNNQNRGQGNK